MENAGVLFALGASLCWGSVPVIYKWGMGTLPLEKMNLLRSFGFLGSAALIYFIVGGDLMNGARIEVLLVLGLAVLLANVAGDMLFFVGIDSIGVGMATAITCTYPLFVTAISVAVLGESISFRTMSATFMVVMGLILLRDKSGKKRGAGRVSSARGISLSLLAAFLWGGSMVVTRWAVLVSDLGPAELNLWRALFFFPISMVWWEWRRRSIALPGRPPFLRTGFRDMATMILAGALALSVGGFFITRAMMLAPASLVSPIAATSPMVAAIWGRFLFSERLLAPQLFGVALIIAGSLAISL